MLYDGVEGEAVVAGAFTVTPEARVNSPMRNMCCGALWIDSRFVMPSLRSPAAGESSRRMNGSLQPAMRYRNCPRLGTEEHPRQKMDCVRLTESARQPDVRDFLQPLFR